MTYTFVAVQEHGAWGVTCPSLPGVFGVGKTRKEAEKDFAGSLETLANYLDEIGEKLPTPQRVAIGSLSI
jgi:predicted RNase H-like HicB family nuclease